ncbi:hypothetical protein [Haloarcula sediminis]|uniref:hypothetical protein n=1 Tax=Haloarcula sediminis TaxID=3111777 RepID=UPI002D7779DE|nr:hypothetical protein [Haloarcula sp. CK38]
MEGIERVVSREVQMLRGFAYPPLRRVWFDRETVLMALTDARALYSEVLNTSDTDRKLGMRDSATIQNQICRIVVTASRPVTLH